MINGLVLQCRNKQIQIIMKNLTTEQRDFLKKDIEKAANENNITVNDQISAMQSMCAKRNQEEALSILCDIKHDYI